LSKEIDQAIKDLQKAGFNVEDKGDIKDCLGVHVTKLSDGRLKLWQPHLIRQIVSDVDLPKNVTTEKRSCLIIQNSTT
jgi:hypothetical protein